MRVCKKAIYFLRMPQTFGFGQGIIGDFDHFDFQDLNTTFTLLFFKCGHNLDLSLDYDHFSFEPSQKRKNSKNYLVRVSNQKEAYQHFDFVKGKLIYKPIFNFAQILSLFDFLTKSTMFDFLTKRIFLLIKFCSHIYFFQL